MAGRIMYTGGVVQDGLVLHLDAANRRSYPGFGTAWNDLSGNGNTGTLTNGPTFSSENAGSIVFDGNNDYIDCGSTLQINSNLLGLTVSIWIKIFGRNTIMLVENGTSFTTNTFYLAQEDANRLTFLVYGDGAYDLVTISSPVPYQTNVWLNLVGVWQSGMRCKLYYNSEDRTLALGGSSRTTVQNGNTNLWIGRRPGGSLPFLGNIGNVSIYNRALTQQEITQNFNALRGRYGI
jgi:hypothetical protein